MIARQRIEKVRKLLADESLDAIVVRSVTDLMWLTGFERVFDTEQAHTAVVTRERCVIHTDSRYSSAMRNAAQEEGLWEVDDVTAVDGVPRTASAFLRDVLLAQGALDGVVAIDADTPLSLYRALTSALPKVTFAERRGDILALRSVKEPGEVERLKHAQAIADKAFMELLEKLHAGMSEREASLVLEFALRSNGADELAFSNIVASGPNSANPHAVPGDRRLQAGDFVVVDFGARVDGYRSDTTRTVCVGRPNAEQQRIYEAVRTANEEVESKLKPGVTGAMMHELAEHVLAEYGFAGKMGHGLGHGVGLDIHEQPNLSLRNGKALVVGNVVTVEPGVYISGQNGARLEDYGVVEQDGFVNFTQLPHALFTVG